MIVDLEKLNWMAISVAFVCYFVLGALWFTVLFSKAYAISLGKEHEVPGKPAPLFIVGPAVCSLVITITTALLMNALNISTYGNAALFGIIIGFGYLVANTMNISINPNMPRPIYYGIISGSYHLVGILAVCLIIVSMK